MDNINFIYLERAAKAFDRCINDATTGSVARALYNAKEVVLSEVETMYNVQPVKRGEWEKKSSVGVFRCSLCQHIFMLGADEIDEYHFCPNCGADMRGAENG